MAQFRGFSYDDLSKPLDEMQKAHNEVITDMASLSQNSEILDYYLDPERDKDSYNLYNKFKTEFNFNVDDFARNGLTRNNGMKLLSLHRNYNNNIANILDAVKNRDAERVEQQKLQEQSKGQTIFGLNGTDGNANNRSVDFYLQGNKGFAHQNLDDVRKEAKSFAEAASKRKYTNNFDRNINPDATEANLKALAGQYWELFEETGYNDKESYNIINYLMDLYEPIIDGTDDGSLTGGHPDGFIKNMRRMLQERNIDQFSDKDKTRLINAYINGIDEGLTYEPKYTWKETDLLKKAGASKTYNNNGSGWQSPVPKADERFDQNEFIVKSSFDNSNSKEQNKIYDYLTGRAVDGYYSNIIVDAGKEHNGVRLHRIATRGEYIFNVCSPDPNHPSILVPKNATIGNTTNYVTITINGKDYKVPKQIIDDYQNILNKLGDTFHLATNQAGYASRLKEMVNPQNYNECIEYKMASVMAQNDRDSKDQKAIATLLNIDPSDMSNAIKGAFTQLGSQSLFYNPIYNPRTKTWDFAGEDKDKKMQEAIQNHKDLASSKCSIVYMPQMQNDPAPLWIKIETNINNGTTAPTYLPLATFTSMTRSQEAHALRAMANRRRDILNRNLEILHLDGNVTIQDIKNKIPEYKMQGNEAALDAAYQIIESLEYVNFYLKKQNVSASNGATGNTQIKKYINDLNKAEGND